MASLGLPVHDRSSPGNLEFASEIGFACSSSDAASDFIVIDALLSPLVDAFGFCRLYTCALAISMSATMPRIVMIMRPMLPAVVTSGSRTPSEAPRSSSSWTKFKTSRVERPSRSRRKTTSSSPAQELHNGL